MNAHQEVATRDAEPVSRELSLVERAVNAGADMETVTQLIALQHQQEARQAKRAFDAAMSRALAVMPNIIKEASADRYRYETLTAVVSAVREPLSREGLSFRWKMDQSDRIVRVTCVISHEDGHTEETSLASPAEGPRGTNAVQAIGATVTYLQRYTLKAALGVAAGDDTDGVAPPAPQQRDEPQGPDHNRISPFLQRIVRATQPGDGGDLQVVWNDAKRILRGEDYAAVKAAVLRKKDDLEASND